ncbi:uncharacterized protein CMC5_002560 [Chondromyces crocatus]|uniref:GYF domain-containing protein n=2 Tax=Chondromyces crocatus TaxID=52 RepID=A0A0K1E640_CHOCO|nr:uncharacterized protein CMC5_002560 [Chondromyces crocatus]
MEYTAYDRAQSVASGAGALPGGCVSQDEVSSEAPTMPCIASTDDPRNALPRSIPWCVDRGSGLSAMSTTELWQALESGDLEPETRVWREGLECWTPAHQVRELRWTVSPLMSVEGGPDAGVDPALVSAGLTPSEVGAMRDWAAAGELHEPEPSTQFNREQRSVLPTMMSTPEPTEEPEGPISLELPTFFPEAPAATPITSGPVRLDAGEGHGEQDASQVDDGVLGAAARVAGVGDRAARLPGEFAPARASRLRRLAERLGLRKDAVFVAASFTLAGVATGATLMETWAPPAALAVDLAVQLPMGETVASAGGERIGVTVDVFPNAETEVVSAASGALEGATEGAHCVERGQQRLRRGHADRFRGRRADSVGAKREESR